MKNYTKYIPEKLIEKIYHSGVVGLGGGEFSSAKKLKLSLKKVSVLIVNAVESEPYVTSDYCLIDNYIKEVLQGCKIISWITKVKKVLIAIQEDDAELISKICYLIKDQSLFKIRVLKKKYPAGSSKVLLKSLTKKEIPYNKHSIDIGYLIFNVATIYAIKRAVIDGEPLIQRIVTILSDNKSLSGNFWIRIGTPIKHFLNNKSNKKNTNLTIYLGGPFMGKKINDVNYFILKKTNFIFFKFDKKIQNNINEYNCIRCGYCSNVCPVNLLPQEIYWYAKNRNHEKTNKYHVLDCIECKACEKICPSYIPLVKYFKKEKKIISTLELESHFKRSSFRRFKNKEKRLLNERKKLLFNINSKSHQSLIVNEKEMISLEKKDYKIKNFNKNERRRMVQEAINRMKNKTL